jgi:hypothetical protein
MSLWKSCPKFSPTHFCHNYCITPTVERAALKCRPFVYVISNKLYKNETIDNWAKIRPIWSLCSLPHPSPAWTFLHKKWNLLMPRKTRPQLISWDARRCLVSFFSALKTCRFWTPQTFLDSRSTFGIGKANFFDCRTKIFRQGSELTFPLVKRFARTNWGANPGSFDCRLFSQRYSAELQRLLNIWTCTIYLGMTQIIDFVKKWNRPKYVHMYIHMCMGLIQRVFDFHIAEWK